MKSIVWAALLLAMVHSPTQAQGFNPWLNARIDSLVAVRLSVRDPAKQVQAPAGSARQSPLVDRAAVPDVGGIAVRFPDQSVPGWNGALAVLTGDPLYLLSILQGKALDPNHYLSNAVRRRLGFSVAFDNDSTGSTSTTVQAKVLLKTRGNPLAGNARVSPALNRATASFGRLRRAVEDLLWERAGAGNFPDADAFLNTLVSATGLAAAFERLGNDGLTDVDRIIEDHLQDFVELQQVIEGAALQARSRPMFALGLVGTSGGSEPDQLRASAIYDVARGPFDLVLNAAWNYVQADDDDINRAELAGQLFTQLTRDNRIDGITPITLAVGALAGYELDGANDFIFKAQARIAFPIAQGVVLPLSVTWASRRDINDEAQVRGRVGMTLDVTQLLTALK